MRLGNILILLIFIVSYAHGQNSNANVRVVESELPATVRTPSPASIPTPVPANTIVRGKVFYEDDKTPVRRSLIMFFNLKDRGDSMTLTDEKGNFELKNVKAGVYYPLVTAPGAINFFSNLDFSRMGQGEQAAFADAVKSTTSFAADGKNALQVEIPIKRGGAISGKVVYADGSPAIGSSVQIYKKVDGKFQPVVSDFMRLFIATALSASSFQTDDRGMYRVLGLPAGEYYIGVSEPAYHAKNAEDYPFRGPDYAMPFLFGGSSFLNSFFPNTIEAKDAQPVKVELGKDRTGADITIPDWKLFSVSGKIVSAKDGKLVKARIYAMEANSLLTKMPSPSDIPRIASKAYSQTDKNGNWSFINLPRGRYTIFVEPLDENDEYSATMSNTVSNIVANTANTASNQTAGNIKRIPKPKYAKTSYDVLVENSDVKNVSIKADLEAVIKGSAEFDVQTSLSGTVRIEITNEMGVSVGRDVLYLYDSSKYLGKTWKQEFSIDSLPKGKLKMKITMTSENVFLKSATLNGLDLQQNSFEIGAGQTLYNFKLAFGTKK